jgi:hypothetical protein
MVFHPPRYVVLVSVAFSFSGVMINQYIGIIVCAQPQNRKQDVQFMESAMVIFATHMQNRKSGNPCAPMMHL